MRPCAWVLRIEAGRHSLRAGDHVERGDGFFAEGAWKGAFSAAGLSGSTFVCGSGGVIDGEAIHFRAPSHSLEGIYVFVGERMAVVSNSIHAVIAACPEAYPADLDGLRRRVSTARAGSAAYERDLYAVGPARMLRFLFGGFSIGIRDLSVRERERPVLDARFSDFAGYKEVLLATLRDLIGNARSPERRHPYRQLVTCCSRGYDSVACAALSRELGAERALTVAAGRGGSNDSGREIAEALGLECLEFERPGAGLEHLHRVRQRGKNPAAQLAKGLAHRLLSGVVTFSRSTPPGFSYRVDVSHIPDGPYDDLFATVGASEDLYFAAFEPYLRDAILLTGHQGGRVWSIGAPSGPEVVRSDMSGTGFDEFRKRLGFVDVPVPFIAAEQSEQIARITAGAEMAPYTVGGHYDRPIPRRIIEEAGVRRSVFGVTKSGGSVLVENAGPLRQRKFAALVDEYRAALARPDEADPAGGMPIPA